MKPFVDYYSQNEISPVAQDISDLPRHFDRRRSLYRALGIVPAFVAGRSVIEFGPGSGYNAIYTGSLNPQRYVLVDGNPVGLVETNRLLQERFGTSLPYEMVESLIEDFETDERFDVSLCEGTIPFQLEPEAFTRKVGSFCKPGGVLIITCASAASVMGEITRRLIASRIADGGAPLPERLAALRPIFAPHLATMKNMSRSVDDWILDNIIHPFIGKTFSIEAAIDAVGDEFELYGQSPQFVADWRWYKDIWGDAKQFNARAKDAYLRNVVNFLDYRVELSPHSPAVGDRISTLAESVYGFMQDYELHGIEAARRRACEAIGDLAETVAHISPLTAESLRAAAAFVMDGDRGTHSLAPFESYFGRGQQYVSFIRRAG
jgi:SAM-dependent methyltransferase